jgi:hypothetical protein
MKTLLHAMKQTFASLSTGRKAHLLHSGIYAAMGSEAKTERRLSLEQQAAPASNGIMSTRRQAHLQLGNIYAELGHEAKTERRKPPTTVTHHHYNLFAGQMTPVAG